MTNEEETRLHKAVFDKWLSDFIEDTKHELNCNKNKDGSTMSYNSPIEIVKKMQEQ